MSFKPYRYLRIRRSRTYILPSSLSIVSLPPINLLLKPSIVVSPFPFFSTSLYLLINTQSAIQRAVLCSTSNFLHTPHYSFFLLAFSVRMRPDDRRLNSFLYFTLSRGRRLTAADSSLRRCRVVSPEDAVLEIYACINQSWSTFYYHTWDSLHNGYIYNNCHETFNIFSEFFNFVELEAAFVKKPCPRVRLEKDRCLSQGYWSWIISSSLLLASVLRNLKFVYLSTLRALQYLTPIVSYNSERTYEAFAWSLIMRFANISNYFVVFHHLRMVQYILCTSPSMKTCLSILLSKVIFRHLNPTLPTVLTHSMELTWMESVEPHRLRLQMSWTLQNHRLVSMDSTI